MARQADIRLVVFDWAGTVVDFGCCGPAQAFVDGFAAVGVEVTMAEARGPMGLAKKEHIRTMLAQPEIAARWLDTKGYAANEKDVDQIYQIVTPKQIEAAGRLGKPLEGLLECVEALRRRGIKIAGTTGYFREAAEAARQTAAEYGYIPDANVCADDVPAGRPAPWMLFRAMEATGCYPASSVVKIGDTVADIGEGLNAGALSLGVVDSSNGMGLDEAAFKALSPQERSARREQVVDKLNQAGAHATIDRLADLPEILDEVHSRWLAGELR